jgi:nucleotide-binding universal stress UspA family protein
MESVYHRIFVALDPEGVADKALQQALALARAFDAQLRLVHVIDPYGTDAARWTTPAGHEQALADARRKVAAMLEAKERAVAATGAKVEHALLELEGGKDVSARLLADAVQWGADLIVMGTHGRRGIERIALGSIAEGVVRSALVPTLLVREPHPEH